eukprot:416618_1
MQECISSTFQIIMCIFLLISFITIIPFSIHCVYKIHQSIQTSDAFMMARYPKLSEYLLFINLFDITLIQPLSIILFVTHYTPLIDTINILLTDTRFIIFGFFFISRVWLLHFDYEYGRECVGILWNRQKTIKRFYFSHRHTYGNVKTVTKATLFLSLLCLIMLLIPYIMNIADITTLPRLLLFTIEALTLCILYCKISKVHDKFGIKNEILFITLCPGLLSLIYYILFSYIHPAKNILTIDHCNKFFIHSFFMLFIIATTIFIKTLTPLKFRSNEEHTHTIRLMKIGNRAHNVCFEDVLGSRSAFLLFIQHLESEFCVENILFLVEVAKFREHYLSLILNKAQYQLILKTGINTKLLANDSQSKDKLRMSIKRCLSSPPSIPSNSTTTAVSLNDKVKYSSLIDFEMVQEFIQDDFELSYNCMNTVEPLLSDFIPTPSEYNQCTVTETALNIFHHFIADGSTHMINISGSCRNKIKNLMEKKFINEELSKIFIFDEAFNEIYSTLDADTFLRFKLSDEFKKYLKMGCTPKHNTELKSHKNSFAFSFSDIHQTLNRDIDNVIKNNNKQKNNGLGLELYNVSDDI